MSEKCDFARMAEEGRPGVISELLPMTESVAWTKRALVTRRQQVPNPYSHPRFYAKHPK
jgi:hypothetical protein